MEAFEELKSTLAEKDSGETNFIVPFPLLTKSAVESLRYRAEVLFYFIYPFQILLMCKPLIFVKKNG